MDIRIGNDICVQVPVSEIEYVNAEDIKLAKCTFIKQECAPVCKKHSHPIFHLSSQYTIRSCGKPSYYVNPHNQIGCNMNDCPHCGFVVCGHDKHACSFVSKCIIQDGQINAYFPSEFQKCIGTYKCVFEVKTKEDSWDKYNIHTYSLSYDDVFDLAEDGVQNTSVIINPIEEKDHDTHVCAIDEESLKKYEDDYTKLILISKGFKLHSIPGFKKTVHISHGEKNIVIISKYDSLQFKINENIIPMKMSKISDDYYMYISEYTYLKCKRMEIINTNNSNPIYSYGEWIDKKVLKEITLNAPSSIPSDCSEVTVTVLGKYSIYKHRFIYLNGTVIGDEEKDRYEQDGVLVEASDIFATALSGTDYRGPLVDGKFTINVGENDVPLTKVILITATVNGINGQVQITQSPKVIEPTVVFGPWDVSEIHIEPSDQMSYEGGIVRLLGVAKRDVRYDYGDHYDEDVETSTNIKWSVSIDDQDPVSIVGNAYTVNTSDVKHKYVFTYDTNSDYGYNAIGSFTLLQGSLPKITLSEQGRIVEHDTTTGSFTYTVDYDSVLISAHCSTCNVSVDRQARKITWHADINTQDRNIQHVITVKGNNNNNITATYTVTQKRFPAPTPVTEPAFYGSIDFDNIPTKQDIIDTVQQYMFTEDENSPIKGIESVVDVELHDQNHVITYDVTLNHTPYACAFFLLPNIDLYNNKKIVICSGTFGDDAVSEFGNNTVDGTVVTINDSEYKLYAVVLNTVYGENTIDFALI